MTVGDVAASSNPRMGSPVPTAHTAPEAKQQEQGMLVVKANVAGELLSKPIA